MRISIVLLPLLLVLGTACTTSDKDYIREHIAQRARTQPVLAISVPAQEQPIAPRR